MSLVRPWRLERAITDVDVGELVSLGVRCVLFDRDNTVVPRDTGVAPAEVMEWISRVRAAGIALCMVSNNFHTQQVEASAAELRCAVVHHAMKPAPFAVSAFARGRRGSRGRAHWRPGVHRCHGRQPCGRAHDPR